LGKRGVTQVSEETSEPDQTPDSEEILEADPIPQAHNEEGSDEAQ